MVCAVMRLQSLATNYWTALVLVDWDVNFLESTTEILTLYAQVSSTFQPSLSD